MFRIGFIGGGPASLYIIDRILESGAFDLELFIFEKADRVGVGMPYCRDQVAGEHLVHILCEETPELNNTPILDWLQSLPEDQQQSMGLPEDLCQKSVLTRVNIGDYNAAQYQEIVEQLRQRGVQVHEFVNTVVFDAIDDPMQETVSIVTQSGIYIVDMAIIATGHVFPSVEYGPLFESPWPTHKVLPEGKLYNHPVGLLGASLSAYDMTISLALRHGHFNYAGEGDDVEVTYVPNPETEEFHIAMHSGRGIFPHVRPEFEWPQVSKFRQFSRQQFDAHVAKNNGTLNLNQFFVEVMLPVLVADLRRNGLNELAERAEHPSMSLKGFFEMMAAQRRYSDPFEGMRQELLESQRSIAEDVPIFWKESVDEMIYTLNDWMHLMSAEDFLLWKKVVIPFVSNLFAFLPAISAKRLLALRDAGKVSMRRGRITNYCVTGNSVTVDRIDPEDGSVREKFALFINCSGQEVIGLEQFPLPSLVRNGNVSEPKIRFQSAEAGMREMQKDPGKVEKIGNAYFYKPGGIAVQPFTYQVIGINGQSNPRLLDIAYPHLKGRQPYHAGLQQSSDMAIELVPQILRAMQHRIAIAV